MNKKRILFLATSIILSIGVFLSCSNDISKDESNTGIAEQSKNEDIPEDKDTEPTNISESVSISVAGDVMYHDDQINAAYDSSTDTYDFSGSFDYVEKYIKDADLSLLTFEGNFAGREHGYYGYPLFNSPEVALDSLKSTGFDMISLASNHIVDWQTEGFFDSINEIEKRNLEVLGVRENSNDLNYSIKEINGIKIGISSYTYETIQQYGQRSINGIVIPSELNGLVNSFGTETLNNDLISMKQTVDNMKSDGAEFIIFLMHWGDEYSTTYSATQKNIATALNSYGVDVIFGSHPHVVQPIETIVNAETSEETLVFYALGNFLSNQREETMGNEKSEDGSIAQIEITRDENGEVYLKNHTYIPTWVYKYTDENGKVKYEVLPSIEILESENPNDFPPDILDALETSKTSTFSIMGQP